MNNKEYIRNLCKANGLVCNYSNNEEIYFKKVSNWEISLNLSKDKISYPKQIEGKDRNTDTNKLENLVVFECINRLLNKGYNPNDIELEKAWHLGHDSKSGRCDIIIYDGSKKYESKELRNVLCIIECKTFGNEFDKELKNLNIDGGQLFSYFQQERSCKWLVLYASRYNENIQEIEYQIATIKSSDDSNLISLSENKKDSDIELYKNSYTASQLYSVWKQTYDGKILDDVIFRNDTKAYEVGIKPLLKKDLIDFNNSGKIINDFEEILRHNNVSDKENAFNRLIALFICKLVDEITKNDDDEVEFQYKVGTDTYETLQDRLQRLHKDGMDKFMKEKILYISDDYPVNLVRQYTNKSNRDELIKDLKNTIRILKFYTNNDFAFKDVHNEELFYQNGKLLVEVIQLFQNYKIIGSSNLQLLGDLFEKLLDKGFKQNEGQFFTPTPITRFIWKSLPLEKILFKNEKFEYPKIIDYACGAGHFLTEGIEEIKTYLNKHNIEENAKWYKDNIYGIEKDYRLSRVSKVSMFMHGAGDSNIIFGDGLENDKGVENNLFDILVANPPYSVKGFKPHLNLKNNKLDIIDYISNDGSEIEVCFVERISQLLKPKGIASVILPSSLLSNNSNSYVKARELILKNFYIRGIASFGNLTFGATGTNTVVLFLEKFNEPPKKMNICLDSVNAIFNSENLNGWEDNEILESYLEQINVDIDFYKSFISQKLLLSRLKKNKHFSIYVQSYGDSSDVTKLLNSKSYKKLNKKEQYKKYLENFYKYILPIEREKIYYFSLIYKQKTIIIKSPTDNKPQQEFLGYKWSNRKGAEGIQIIKMGGKLFDSAHNDFASDYIRNSFNSVYMPDSEYSMCLNTKDIIDFSREIFNKDFNLVKKEHNILKTKYQIVKLEDICDVKIGGTPSRKNQRYFN